MGRELVLINPPALLERPPVEQSGTLFVPERMVITAMNPGILSLATYLDSKGFDVEIVDLALEKDFGSIEERVKAIDAEVVGISSTSGFDYGESRKIAEIVKNHHGCEVVLGGQHAGPLGRIILEEAPFIDAVVKFEGELVLEQMLQRKRKKGAMFDIPGVVFRDADKIVDKGGRSPKIKINDLPALKYEMWPDFLKFTPFVEESRGCMYRCNYCSSNTINKGIIDLKNPKKFLEEMEQCVDLFGTDKAYAVLASTYGVNPRYGKEIAQGMKKFGIKWNSEFRADSPWEEFLHDLLDAGYEVVNIGVESGSPEMLKLMGKTKKPEAYLDKMKRLAGEVAGSDAVIRANFMFYAGETPKTLRETIQFLIETPDIDSIQFSPLLVFHGTPVFKNFDRYRREFGSEMITTDYWNERHFYPVHPSSFFSFQEVVQLGHSLEKIFSSEDAWCQAAKSLYSQEDETTRTKVKENLKQSRFRRE